MNKKAILAPAVVPDIQHTVPEVFIFESLGKEDEKAKRFEGQVLAGMLRYARRDQARADIVDWIEGFFNRRPLHSAIGYRTPEAVSTQLQAA